MEAKNELHSFLNTDLNTQYFNINKAEKVDKSHLIVRSKELFETIKKYDPEKQAIIIENLSIIFKEHLQHLIAIAKRNLDVYQDLHTKFLK